MIRYARTALRSGLLSLSAELEYRANFALAMLGAVLGMAGNLFALSLFYQGDYQPGGWPIEHALLLAGVFTALRGLLSAWLMPNLRMLFRDVQMGTLDFVLLRPLDSQFLVSFRRLATGGLPDVVLGLGLMVYAGWQVGLRVEGVLLAVPAMVAGVCMMYAVWFAVGTSSIWLVKVSNFHEALHSLLEAGRYPMSAYPAVHRFIFTFLLPVAFMTTVPAETLLGRTGGGPVLLSLAVSLVLLGGSRWFWRRALRSYTGASA